MMNDATGCSKCLQRGAEIYERFELGTIFKSRIMWHYDYRHTNGELFSCVASTLEECRQKKDEWILKSNL